MESPQGSYCDNVTLLFDKMDKYHEKYLNNKICLLSAFLCTSFVDYPVWVDYFPGTPSGSKKSPFILDKIADMMTETLLPYLNISYREDELDSNDISEYSSYCEMSFEGCCDLGSSTPPSPRSSHQLPDSPSTLLDRSKYTNNQGLFDRETIHGDLKRMIYDEMVRYKQEAVRYDPSKFYHDIGENRNEVGTSDFEKKCDDMLQNDARFWKYFSPMFPILSLANDIFRNIPGTSIHVERSFSLAGCVDRRRQGTPESDQFQMLRSLGSLIARVEPDDMDENDVIFSIRTIHHEKEVGFPSDNMRLL